MQCRKLTDRSPAQIGRSVGCMLPCKAVTGTQHSTKARSVIAWFAKGGLVPDGSLWHIGYFRTNFEARCRNTNFCIFPVEVRGITSKTILLGTL